MPSGWFARWIEAEQGRFFLLLPVAMAAGERAELPGETLTLSGAFLTSAESGFALSPFAIVKPIAFTLKDIGARDDITAGCLTVSLGLSTSFYNFPAYPSQNRRDLRGSLCLHYSNGAPLSYVTELRAGSNTGTDVIKTRIITPRWLGCRTRRTVSGRSPPWPAALGARPA